MLSCSYELKYGGMELPAPSYLALLVALHKIFTNHVPQVHACAKPSSLKKKAFLGCFESVLLGNSFKK